MPSLGNLLCCPPWGRRPSRAEGAVTIHVQPATPARLSPVQGTPGARLLLSRHLTAQEQSATAQDFIDRVREHIVVDGVLVGNEIAADLELAASLIGNPPPGQLEAIAKLCLRAVERMMGTGQHDAINRCFDLARWTLSQGEPPNVRPRLVRLQLEQVVRLLHTNEPVDVASKHGDILRWLLANSGAMRDSVVSQLVDACFITLPRPSLPLDPARTALVTNRADWLVEIAGHATDSAIGIADRFIRILGSATEAMPRPGVAGPANFVDFEYVKQLCGCALSCMTRAADPEDKRMRTLWLGVYCFRLAALANYPSAVYAYAMGLIEDAIYRDPAVACIEASAYRGSMLRGEDFDRNPQISASSPEPSMFSVEPSSSGLQPRDPGASGTRLAFKALMQCCPSEGELNRHPGLADRIKDLSLIVEPSQGWLSVGRERVDWPGWLAARRQGALASLNQLDQLLPEIAALEQTQEGVGR
jgi:hypothetical protein